MRADLARLRRRARRVSDGAGSVRVMAADEEPPDLAAWEPWSPRTLADRMRGLEVPWCVAAGWALDLFRGAQSRPHGDIEMAVPAAGFPAVAARLDDCRFWVPTDGRLVPPSGTALAEQFQTWAWERAAGRWRVDVFREPHDGDTWICRRDDRIRVRYADIIERDRDGIPFLAPEFVLLFKAKRHRDKDEADLASTLPLLDDARLRRLDGLLAVAHPDHPWRAAVAAQAQ